MAQPLRRVPAVAPSLKRECRILVDEPVDERLPLVEPALSELAKTLGSETKARFVLALEAGKSTGDVVEPSPGAGATRKK